MRNKMYNYDDLKNNKIAVYCETAIEARRLIRFMRCKGNLYDIGQINKYFRFNRETYFCLNTRREFYTDHGYEIINFIEVDILEEKTKYEKIKTITGKEIFKNDPYEDEFEKYLQIYGMYSSIEWTKEIEDYAIKQDGWIEFLLKHSFIVENKTEIEFDSKSVYILIDSLKNEYKLQRKYNIFACLNIKFLFVSLFNSEAIFCVRDSFDNILDLIRESDNLNIYKCDNVEEFYKLKELNQLDRVRLKL